FPFISKIASGKLPCLSVFGNDYDTADGTGVRDYIHVVDLAKGHLAAFDFLKHRTCCEAFNLGTGKGTSVLELLKAFEKAAGKEIPYKIAERREGDIAVSYADTRKAKEMLGWEASFNINDMCRDGWKYAKINLF
ncbi:MAG: GDP-mannose 4,6-dehydratase, partial [Oscillospiraceae bacterium]